MRAARSAGAFSPAGFHNRIARNVKNSPKFDRRLSSMKLNQVRWGFVLAGVLVAEATLVAAAFGWVAIYSHLIHPGEAVTFYREYANTASPFVALILGFPVFYMTCRWIGSRAPSQALPTAIAVFGAYCLIELPIVLSAANAALPAWFLAISFPTKFLGCYMGGKYAMREEAARPA